MALVTLPALRQRVQTYTRRGAAPTKIRTFCRFGSKRRLVARIEWLRLCPKAGPLPQLLQTLAMRRRSVATRGLGYALHDAPCDAGSYCAARSLPRRPPHRERGNGLRLGGRGRAAGPPGGRQGARAGLCRGRVCTTPLRARGEG